MVPAALHVPLQQGWPVPPQATQAPAMHLPELQASPSQHGWPMTPHAVQTKSRQTPVEQTFPGQQESPWLPQATQKLFWQTPVEHALPGQQGCETLPQLWHTPFEHASVSQTPLQQGWPLAPHGTTGISFFGIACCQRTSSLMAFFRSFCVISDHTLIS